MSNITEPNIKTEIMPVEYSSDESLTVADVLSIISKTSSYILLAGKKGLSNKCYHMVVLETPEGMDWTIGGEFVLSAGYGLPKDPEGLTEIIKKAAAGRVAAIAIKANRYIREIPAMMLLEAEQLEIPVIQLPETAVYTETIAAFYKELFNKSSSSLIRARSIDNLLMSTILTQDEITDFVISLSNILELSVVILDISYAELYANYRDIINERPVMEELIRLLKSGDVTAGNMYHTGNYYIMGFNLSKGSPESCLYAISSSPVDNIQFNALLESVKILSSGLYKKSLVLKRRFGLRRTLTDILLSNPNPDSDLCKSVTKDMNWQNRKIACIMICFDQKDESDNYYSDYILSVAEHISDDTNFLLKDTAGSIYLFVSFREKQTPGHYISLLEKELEKFRPVHNELFIGASHMYPGVSDITVMFKEAQTLYIYRNKGYRHLCYDEIKTDDLFFPILYDPKFSELYTRYINTVSDYDRRFNTNLLKTLICLFENDLNHKKTAEALFIHVETLRYRLSKIEKMLGISLTSVKDIAVIELCLKNYSQNILSSEDQI